jgi:Rrf2 family protein
MFSQTAEYALRAVVYLASQEGEAQTTQQIAARTKVPAGYLSKVLQNLSRVGLVAAQRGLHGGFSLACDPEELTIWDIIQAVDPVRRITRCPLGLEGHIKLCPLHRRLDQAIALVEKALKESTLAELLAEPKKGKAPPPLCPVPELVQVGKR